MKTLKYPEIRLHIGGEWWGKEAETLIPVINPATGEVIGEVPVATSAELERLVQASAIGFEKWRKTGVFDRYNILRKAAQLLRDKAGDLAPELTLEQGRPVGDSRMEILMSADAIDWFAEEARRTYGRIIPARASGVSQLVIEEPVGPVAAFSTWNVPVNHAARKVAAALAAGCSVILKGPEEAPAATMGIVQAFLDAGVPKETLGLVFGVPKEISEFLIPNPVIKKITFTGSTAVGKMLASMAGKYMKRATMELGGHAPAIVFDDADVKKAATILGTTKFRNSGQICISPTRFLIQDGVFEDFCDKFVKLANAIKVGDGFDPDSQMGPLSTLSRLDDIERLVQDAVSKGAVLKTGGKRTGNKGYFYEPTVLINVPIDAFVMNEEPFGPIAIINRFTSYEEVIAETNRLDYALACYAYTSSQLTTEKLAEDIESGMISINHHGLGLPETPFGGIKDSGYGSEGGTEAIKAFLNQKFVSRYV